MFKQIAFNYRTALLVVTTRQILLLLHYTITTATYMGNLIVQ